MNQETLQKEPKVDLQRYHHAGLGFLFLNLIWFGLFFWFLPPFNLDFSAYSIAIIYLLLIGVLARFIYKGSRKLTIVLAVIFSGRFLVSIYTLATGEAFAVVPFVLPGHVICVYLLGRAAWDWP
ncbi:MAG: hypothetical protein VYC17_06260 [Nitrospinota bacterium]|nr:hypothetical protein [Nitrospinota bacterium]